MQNDENCPEPTLWGLFVLLVVIFVMVYLFSGCLATGKTEAEIQAEVDAKVEARVALIQEEKQNQTIDAEGDVTVINIENAGWVVSAAGIGWALMLFGRRKPQRAVDRFVGELRRGSFHDIPAKAVIRNINNVGKSDKGYDATERYIHSRVQKAKNHKL